jgi:hypothetical protein
MIMRDFGIGIDIAAPAHRVWQVLSEFERWSEWTPSVVRVESLSAPPRGPGSRVRIYQPGLRPAVWVVTHWELNRRFAWTANHPGVVVVADHLLASTPGGCHVELTIRFDGVLGSLAGRMVRGLTARNLELESNGLRARSEATDGGGTSIRLGG